MNNTSKKPSLLALTTLIILGLSWSFGQLQRWQVTPQIAVYVHEVVMAGWLLGLGMKPGRRLGLSWLPKLKQLRKFNGKIRLASQSNLVIQKNTLVFALTLLLLIILGWGRAAILGYELLVPLLYFLRLFFYLLFFWSLSTQQWVTTYWLKWGWWLAGSLVVILGWAQYFFLPDLRWLTVFGWDDHYYRLVGSWLDPAFMGAILIGVFWQTEWVSKNSKQILLYFSTPRFFALDQKIWTALLWLIKVTTVMAIVLTFSRSTYLAWFFTLLTAVVIKKYKVLPALLLVFILVTTIQLAPKPDGEGVKLDRMASVSARGSNASYWLSSMNKTDWLIGRGLFVKPKLEELKKSELIDSGQVEQSGGAINPAIPVANHARLPDNIFVLLLSSAGVGGTLLLLWLALPHLNNLWRTDNYLALTLVAFIIHSQFNNTLLQPLVLLWWGGLWAIKSSSN